MVVGDIPFLVVGDRAVEDLEEDTLGEDTLGEDILEEDNLEVDNLDLDLVHMDFVGTAVGTVVDTVLQGAGSTLQAAVGIRLGVAAELL